MRGHHRKSLRQPDEFVEFDGMVESIVQIGGVSVGEVIAQPGWRWSTAHPHAKAGREWCESHHIGVVIEGRFGFSFRDGATVELGPHDVFDIPPGHDGFTIGDEPCTTIEWSGLRSFGAPSSPLVDRSLLALLFTDIVGSTATAARQGDLAWMDRLSEHYDAARHALERWGGVEVETTGDGQLAVFESPARALRCAAAISEIANGQGLHIRAGVHVGEVSVGDHGVRGIAVHEAARVMAAAGADEVLLTDIAHTLVAGSAMRFEDRGSHSLKGIDRAVQLFAYMGG